MNKKITIEFARMYLKLSKAEKKDLFCSLSDAEQTELCFIVSNLYDKICKTLDFKDNSKPNLVIVFGSDNTGSMFDFTDFVI